MEILLFLSSGLFLGWSLGANDAANVFGTAVGARMVRFTTAALVCSVFIVLGATISGAGAAHTLGRLGAVNALPGSFTVALASGLALFLMIRLKLPVSTSQSIVGAIIGWNFYSASVTDTASLSKIVLTWVACPLISGAIAVVLFIFTRWLLRVTRPHMLSIDAGTRLGLLVAGAFGSYSLGANNIANVMGVFVPDNPFTDIDFFGLFTVTAVQQLFFLGAVAIAVGVFTYSRRVMSTVGGGLVRISPVPALLIVLAQSLTLFLFASESLEHFLASHGLPTIPLVPVSSSQAVIGAIIGISLFKGSSIRYRVLGEIAAGWVATPIIAGILAFLLLFVMDNVFDQQVFRSETYRVDDAVRAELVQRGVAATALADFTDRPYTNPSTLKRDLSHKTELTRPQVNLVLDLSHVGHWVIRPGIIAQDVDKHWLSPDQVDALRALQGRSFEHAWELEKALAALTPDWRARPPSTVTRTWNKERQDKLDYVFRLFSSDAKDE